MKKRLIIAVHGRNGLCRKMPEAAETLGVSCKQVDTYGPEFHEQLEGCEAFLISLNHENPRDMLNGRIFLEALETQGIKVFPSHASCWHFDDKFAQQELLRAINAPMPGGNMFFRRRDAMEFLKTCEYPQVFKLRKGAGAINVKLVRNEKEGRRLTERMFGRGIPQHPPMEGLKRGVSRAKKNRVGKDPFAVRARRAGRLWLQKFFRRERERGYVYFQEFIPDQTHDTRVTIIGDRAFVFRREVRENDFRASGSGRIKYPASNEIPHDMVDSAFEISRKLGFQSMAYDFVRHAETQQPLIIEMCFTFNADAVAECPGYTTPDHQWVEGHFRPERCILEDLLADA